MDWTPSRIQRYEPPPTFTYAEKRKVREDAKLEQAKQEARVVKEIEALERKLRQVQLEKTKRSSGSSSTTTRSLLPLQPRISSKMQQRRDERNSSVEGKDPAFFDIQSPAELVACTECGREMPLRSINKHHVTDCNGRYVECRQPGCKARFREVNRNLHEKHECKTIKRNKKMVADGSSKLSMPVSCPLGCSSGVMKKDIPRHVNLVCPNRKVTCPHMGCDVRLPVDDMEIHAATKCKVMERRNTMAASSSVRRLVPVACSPHHQMGCGKMILPKDLKRHELHDCPHRLVRCGNSGCGEMIALNILSFHENSLCKAMLAKESMQESSKLEYACPLDCGEYLMLSETGYHKKNECVNRIVECSVVGCGKKMSFHQLAAHEQIYERFIEQASQKFYYVNPDTEETLWENPGCALMRTREYYLDKYESRPQIVLCSLGCRTSLRNSIKVIRDHVHDVCNNQVIECPTEGTKCTKMMLRRNLEKHRKEDCVVGKRIQRLARLGQAQRMLINCPYCDVELQMKHMKRHTTTECRQRKVPCKYWDCKLMLSANAFHVHVLSECEHRRKWSSGVAAARERVAKSGGKPFLPDCFGRKGQEDEEDEEDVE